jgi:hypothetical protein
MDKPEAGTFAFVRENDRVITALITSVVTDEAHDDGSYHVTMRLFPAYDPDSRVWEGQLYGTESDARDAADTSQAPTYAYVVAEPQEPAQPAKRRSAGAKTDDTK